MLDIAPRSASWWRRKRRVGSARSLRLDGLSSEDALRSSSEICACWTRPAIGGSEPVPAPRRASASSPARGRRHPRSQHAHRQWARALVRGLSVTSWRRSTRNSGAPWWRRRAAGVPMRFSISNGRRCPGYRAVAGALGPRSGRAALAVSTGRRRRGLAAANAGSEALRQPRDHISHRAERHRRSPERPAVRNPKRSWRQQLAGDTRRWEEVLRLGRPSRSAGARCAMGRVGVTLERCPLRRSRSGIVQRRRGRFMKWHRALCPRDGHGLRAVASHLRQALHDDSAGRAGISASSSRLCRLEQRAFDDAAR